VDKIEKTLQARPGIALVLGLIGILSILGGIILAVQSRFGAGYTWLFSGFISGVLCFAFAEITSYLYRISKDTETLVLELCKPKERITSTQDDL